MLSSLCLYIFTFFLSIFNPIISVINKIDESLVDGYEYKLDEDIKVIINNDDTNQLNIKYYYKNRIIYDENATNLSEFERLNNNTFIKEDRIILIRNVDKKICFINAYFNGEIINNNLEEESDSVYAIIDREDYYLFSTIDGKLKSLIINNNNIIKEKNYEINEGRKVRVKKVVINDNYIHLVLEKDLLCGGDFGNGGNPDNDKAIILFTIDKGLEKKDVKSFNEKEFVNIEIKDGFIFLSMDKSLYCYDKELNKIKALEFNSLSIFDKVEINNFGIIYYARFFKNGLEVWNINNQKLVYDTEYSYIDDVIELDDKYVSIKYMNDSIKFIEDINLYDITLFNEDNDYNSSSDKPTNINEYIYSFNKRIDRSKVQTIGGFNSNEAGSYVTYYIYDSLELTGITHVFPTINVRDNVTYPINYKLEFNTRALLNGYEIYNNYPLERSGEYKLELIMDDKIFKTIYFYVGEKYSNLNNNRIVLRNYDYYVNEGDELKLEYKIPKIVEFDSENTKIEEIWVNNEKISDFESFKSSSGDLVIYLYLRGLKRGNNEILVNFIKTSDYFYEIGEKISVFVLDCEPSNIINCSVNNNKIDFDLNIEDRDNTIKYFYINYYNGNSLVHSDFIDIKETEYIINNTFSFTKIVIGESYDIKLNNLIDNDLFEISYNDISKRDRISFEILNREESIQSARISVSKTNNIKKVNLLNSNNDNVYIGSNYNYLVIILSCIIVLVVGLLISVLIIRKNYGLKFFNLRNNNNSK